MPTKNDFLILGPRSSVSVISNWTCMSCRGFLQRNYPEKSMSEKHDESKNKTTDILSILTTFSNAHRAPYY